MSSQETREESCTDPNGDRCGNCGEFYTHTTTAGPGRSKRSCGCDVVLMEVADDTDNTFANVAIRALNTDGDVETAPAVHEGTRGRLVTDGGRPHEPTYECRHCSWAGDECDRRDHYPVCPECSRIVECREGLVADGGHDPVICDNCGRRVPFQDGSWVSVSVSLHGCNDRSDDFAVSVCADCGQNVVEALGESTELIEPTGKQLASDGGVPEDFEDLVGTCESCGDDVDPDRLIEGECPGCHYRPVADGGTTWTDLTGFKRDLLEAIRRLENDDETSNVYGLVIKREVERVYGEEIHHGRLYPNLNDLVEAGLIAKGQLDRRTNEYELTNEAEAMLEQRARLLADACGMEQPVADGGDQA